MVHTYEGLAAGILAGRESELAHQKLQESRALIVAAVFPLPCGDPCCVGETEHPQTKICIYPLVPREVHPARHRSAGEIPLIGPVEALADVEFGFELQRN